MKSLLKMQARGLATVLDPIHHLPGRKVDPRFVILGGTGQAGVALSKLMLQHTGARITLAGRDMNKAKKIITQLQQQFGERVNMMQIDVTKPAHLSQLGKGEDMVVVASSTVAQTKQVAEACIQHKVDYLDLQASPKRLPVLKALSEKMGNLTFITEAGWHPGLPSALVRYAADRFQAAGGEVREALTYGVMHTPLPDSTACDEIGDLFGDGKSSCKVYTKGKWESSCKGETVDLGQNGGSRKAYPFFMQELADLPKLIPSLQRTGLWMCGTCGMMDNVIFPWLALRKKLGASWETVGRAYTKASRKYIKPPYICGVQLQAKGVIKGKDATLKVWVGAEDPYVMTALPVAAYLMQYMDGTAKRPGLWYMGHVADSARLLHDMNRMGARFEQTQL